MPIAVDRAPLGQAALLMAMGHQADRLTHPLQLLSTLTRPFDFASMALRSTPVISSDSTEEFIGAGDAKVLHPASLALSRNPGRLPANPTR